MRNVVFGIVVVVIWVLSISTAVSGTLGGKYDTSELATEKAVAVDLRAFANAAKIYTALELDTILKALATQLVYTHRRQVGEIWDNNAKYNVSNADAEKIKDIKDGNLSVEK